MPAFSESVIERAVLARLNPALPAKALDDAFRTLTRPEGAELVARSRALHRLLVNGVTVEYHPVAGDIRGEQVRAGTRTARRQHGAREVAA
jgi:type I restriction enzyme R subunit